MKIEDPEHVGHFTEISPRFPPELGGGSADPWSDEWTDEQKKFALANFGYYSGDENPKKGAW